METTEDTAALFNAGMPHPPLRKVDDEPPLLYLVGEHQRDADRPVVVRGRKLVCINGRWHSVAGPVATFEQIIGIAFPREAYQRVVSATVTWRRGAAGKPRGSLAPRGSVPVADGMLISAVATILS